MPPRLNTRILNVLRELRQQKITVARWRRKRLGLTDRLIVVLLTRLKREYRLTAQLPPNLNVRLRQVLLNPRFIPPRKIERRPNAKAREIRRSLLPNASHERLVMCVNARFFHRP